MLVEVCSNSLESALNAQKAGADRIELCSELSVGGITPSYGLLKSVKEHIEIPVHVLIRPRSGDFTFSDLEFNLMKKNIELCVDLGFDGIVSGILHADFTLDVERTKILIDMARDLKFTFHRAFDWVADPMLTMEQLQTLGVDYILTSGQQNSALTGLELLTEINKVGTTCSIMPGGGIKEENVHHFKNKGFNVIHLTGGKYEQKLAKEVKVTMNSPSLLYDQGVYVSNTQTLENVLREVK
ncbi:copper homeostasis protein CutC [Maribacter sp. HTCC2170]|uniref:copper homeostasis protein CutC n=1 Tax=Maribacter sp. (strain HTCC2170 / KCCM 42371) TaxID=313603 RepID=UPI00006BD2CB|nr:copper homeostasis protein CutC [Maribacter sp. HTCC2170]EAR02245.1 copper homeostasis protein [Maribacter sp. HTCC2170]